MRNMNKKESANKFYTPLSIENKIHSVNILKMKMENLKKIIRT